MNIKQEVLTALKSYNFKPTEKEINSIIWLVEMEDQSIEEAIDSIYEDRYMDAGDIDLDY